MIVRMNIRIIAILVLFVGGFAPSWLAAAEQASAGAKRSSPVRVGDIAPDFTLEDQNGRKLTLSAEWKKQPVVLVFYRGYW